MTERRRQVGQYTTFEDAGQEDMREAESVQHEELPAMAEKKENPVLKQLHKVTLGDNVMLNGTLFTVSSRQYAWTMTCPDGSEGNLMNPTMPGPSFVAAQAGDYLIHLPTDDGTAEITVRVSE